MNTNTQTYFPRTGARVEARLPMRLNGEALQLPAKDAKDANEIKKAKQPPPPGPVRKT